MKTYPIDLTFNEHKVLLHILHGTILDLKDMPSDDISLLPVLMDIHKKYSDNFGKSGMFEELVSEIH